MEGNIIIETGLVTAVNFSGPYASGSVERYAFYDADTTVPMNVKGGYTATEQGIVVKTDGENIPFVYHRDNAITINTDVGPVAVTINEVTPGMLMIGSDTQGGVTCDIFLFTFSDESAKDFTNITGDTLIFKTGAVNGIVITAVEKTSWELIRAELMSPEKSNIKKVSFDLGLAQVTMSTADFVNATEVNELFQISFYYESWSTFDRDMFDALGKTGFNLEKDLFMGFSFTNGVKSLSLSNDVEITVSVKDQVTSMEYLVDDNIVDIDDVELINWEYRYDENSKKIHFKISPDKTNTLHCFTARGATDVLLHDVTVIGTDGLIPAFGYVNDGADDVVVYLYVKEGASYAANVSAMGTKVSKVTVGGVVLTEGTDYTFYTSNMYVRILRAIDGPVEIHAEMTKYDVIIDGNATTDRDYVIKYYDNIYIQVYPDASAPYIKGATGGVFEYDFANDRIFVKEIEGEINIFMSSTQHYGVTSDGDISLSYAPFPVGDGNVVIKFSSRYGNVDFSVSMNGTLLTANQYSVTAEAIVLNTLATGSIHVSAVFTNPDTINIDVRDSNVTLSSSTIDYGGAKTITLSSETHDIIHLVADNCAYSFDYETGELTLYTDGFKYQTIVVSAKVKIKSTTVAVGDGVEVEGLPRLGYVHSQFTLSSDRTVGVNGVAMNGINLSGTEYRYESDIGMLTIFKAIDGPITIDTELSGSTKYSVEVTGAGCDTDSAEEGKDLTVKLTAPTGYTLPGKDKITVKIGSSVLAFDYNGTTGTIKIAGDLITGDVSITVTCLPYSYTVDDDLAEVVLTEDSANKTVQNAKDGTVEIQVADENAEQISLKNDSLSALLDAMDETINEVKFDVPEGSVTVPKDILENVTGDLKVSVKEISIPSVLRDKLDGGRLFDITMLDNSEYVTSFPGGLKVSLKYELSEGQSPDNVKVWFVDSEGVMTVVEATYSNGYATFTTDHLSQYAVGYEKPSTGGDSPDDMMLMIIIAVVIVACVGIGAVMYLRTKRE